MKEEIELGWTRQVVMEMVETGAGSYTLYGWTTPTLPGFMVLQTGGGWWFALTGTAASGRALAARLEETLCGLLELETSRDEMLDHLDFYTYSSPKHVFVARSVKVLELCAFVAKMLGDPLAQPGMNTGERETSESSESALAD